MSNQDPKDPNKGRRRSSDWYGKADKDGFGHRSWMKNRGLPADQFDGRPIIGICILGLSSIHATLTSAI